MNDSGTPFNDIVGTRVRSYREAQGWSLNEFAAAAGLSPSQLSRLETGKNEWTVERLRITADTLGVPVADLVSHDLDPGTVRVSVSPDELRVLRSFRTGSMAKFWRTALDMWEARWGKP